MLSDQDLINHGLRCLTTHPDKVDFSLLFDKRLAKNVLWSRDQALLDMARSQVLQRLQARVMAVDDPHQGQLILAQWLCYLPYVMTGDVEMIKLPRYVDGRWVLTEYRIERIPLLPLWWLKQDQYTALALLPMDIQEDPWLIFMATTYPSCPGFWTTLLVDTFPIGNIGSLLYWRNQSKLYQWFERNPGAKITGKSLGGALTLAMAQHMPHQLSIVMNPVLPAREIRTQAPCTVIVHEGDPFAGIGQLPRFCQTFHLRWKHAVCKKYFRSFLSHTQMRFSSADVSVVSVLQRKYVAVKTVMFYLLRLCAFSLLLPMYIVRTILYMFVLAVSHCFRWLR